MQAKTRKEEGPLIVVDRTLLRSLCLRKRKRDWSEDPQQYGNNCWMQLVDDTDTHQQLDSSAKNNPPLPQRRLQSFYCMTTRRRKSRRAVPAKNKCLGFLFLLVSSLCWSTSLGFVSRNNKRAALVRRRTRQPRSAASSSYYSSEIPAMTMMTPSSSSSSSSSSTTNNTTSYHHNQPAPLKTRSVDAPAPRTTTMFSSSDGLSKFHQSILSRTTFNRQRFVTGEYPLTVTVSDNPTRKWLSLSKKKNNLLGSSSETQLLVNGTSPERSLASLDRLTHWLDPKERMDLLENSGMVSLELLAEVHIERPGYLHIMPGNAAGCTKRLLTQRPQQHRWSWNHRRAMDQQQHPAALEEATTDTLFRGDRLWVTGFSLAGRRGLIQSVECDSGVMGTITPRSAKSLLWPNEVLTVPATLFETKQKHQEGYNVQNEIYQDALLVSDGFLVPGKDQGGLYVIKNPGNPETEWTVSLTGPKASAVSSSSSDKSWFYHRATWVDLTGDGRLSILTARCKVTTALGNNNNNNKIAAGITKTGQLVWLECPKPTLIDFETGTPLEKDGTVFDPFNSRHLPWKSHVLASGPDVMFSVADLDTNDDTIEVIASQFFGKKVTLHSIRRGSKPRVVFERVIDAQCGAAFGSILADLDGGSRATIRNASSSRRVIDSGSTVGTIGPGDSFSHLLVTSHECAYVNTNKKDQPNNQQNSSPRRGVEPASSSSRSDNNEGGSLFAYRVPEGRGKWKKDPWIRSTVASGFKVNGKLRNMINPGAPGFVYTFHAKKSDTSGRPMIAVAGDCAESAYLFRPEQQQQQQQQRRREESHLRTAGSSDESTRYKLMVEIQAEATVGSIAIGYDDFSAAEQESGYAKIYIPCYEKDKILVFALGSGADDDDKDDGW